MDVVYQKKDEYRAFILIGKKKRTKILFFLFGNLFFKEKVLVKNGFKSTIIYFKIKNKPKEKKDFFW